MSGSNERQPLLPATAPSASTLSTKGKKSKLSRAGSIAYTILIALLSLVLACALFAILLGSSFWPSRTEIDSLQATAFRYSTTPDRLHVVNITEDGVLVDLTVRCGIDADRAMGVGLARAEKEHAAKMRWRGADAEWIERLREWSVDRMRGYVPDHVHLDVLEPIYVSWNGTRLLTAHIIEPVHVPIVQHARMSRDWLRPMSMRVLAKPESVEDIWALVQQGWRDKVQLAIKTKAMGTLFGYSTERTIDMPVSLTLPRVPGIERPGDIAKLVHLDAYTFETKGNVLMLKARASVRNPIPFDYIVPSLPVAASLPGPLRMAEVITDPFNLSSHISLTMSGHVVAALNDSQALSTFLQNYLHGIDNPIIVDGMGTVPSFANITPPMWVLKALSAISVPLVFPGPRPPPKVVHSVTIERMRISESGGKMRASGLVVAQIDLPGGMEHMDLDVVGVLPDVVIYDGAVQEGRPFGHIKPDEYLDSTTAKSDDVFNPDRLIVTAPIENVPVDILPGQDRILREFVRKIIFRGGASAGIDGNASVIAEIKGMKGAVELRDLPVSGETWVGRK